MSDRSAMSILEHLLELRSRLLKAIIALAVGVVAGTFLTPRVLKFLVAPLGDQVPIAIAPTETPAVYFKVSIVIGLVIGMPVIVYQLFRFVAPGLEPREKRYMLIGAPIAAISFAAGVAFATLVLIPAAMPFLRGFLADIVEQRYSINRYISFVSTVLLWAGLVFETPLVMFFLAKLGVATPRGFAKARRIVVIGAAAGAAVITPTTDPINMLLIMGPFLVLYEFGILLARLA
ncbi:MAG: twin-arginine translocase subunit TatC [Anaerolineae bacterium]|jgi:sec-independent protein translocase protein TatC